MTVDTPTLVPASTRDNVVPPAAPARRVRLATAWLDGCSGCHMSFLDLDERLILVAPLIELVYGPLVDAKEFPENVDVALVEGAVSTDQDIEHIRHIRSRTRLLVSMGDCAVTGNVPAMRNRFGAAACMDRAYRENTDRPLEPAATPASAGADAATVAKPAFVLPQLLERVRPIHDVVNVDVFVPGCPPPADVILHVVSELLAGRIPETAELTRFGR